MFAIIYYMRYKDRVSGNTYSTRFGYVADNVAEFVRDEFLEVGLLTSFLGAIISPVFAYRDSFRDLRLVR